MRIIEILRAGPLTTVQDLGRIGYGQYGITKAGAMDSRSLQIANILVGNPRTSAALEMTLQGIKARFLAKTIIAITGGQADCALNGHAIEGWQSIVVEPGDLLDIGTISAGCRIYLAVKGAFQVNEVLGSASTYLPAKFGGLEGRPLRKEDVLEGVPFYRDYKARNLSKRWIPEYNGTVTLRVVPGLHQELFTPETIELFYSNSYYVTPQSNRIGYRLQGQPLKSSQILELVSDALVDGAIQVPPDGQPILLGVDRNTMGGYPVIGVVISSDFSLLGQIRIGQNVRFQAISHLEAQCLRLQEETFLTTWAHSVDT
ncbi:MAG: 5-oxoprolinase subunit C family protein [Desulfitobacteriaceae bacterium]